MMIDMMFFWIQVLGPTLICMCLLYWMIVWNYKYKSFFFWMIVIFYLFQQMDDLGIIPLPFQSSSSVPKDWTFAFDTSYPIALPSLNNVKYTHVKSQLQQQQQQQKNDLWAFVTGATSGIGRSITIELARRNINIIMVGRNQDTMSILSHDLQSCYGIQVQTIQADLSRPGEARTVYQHFQQQQEQIKVTYLILAAGYGPTSLHTQLSIDKIESTIRINVESTATLATLFGKDMIQQQQQQNNRPIIIPRIMIVSSITGLLNRGGVPNAALYSATKAFGVQLAHTLGMELKDDNITVTAICPGATSTNFASTSQMEEALVWKVPFMVSSSQSVAQQAVQAMFLGLPLHIPGLINQLSLQLLSHFFLPTRWSMTIFKIFWNPWPYSFPSLSSSSTQPKDNEL